MRAGGQRDRSTPAFLTLAQVHWRLNRSRSSKRAPRGTSVESHVTRSRCHRRRVPMAGAEAISGPHSQLVWRANYETMDSMTSPRPRRMANLDRRLRVSGDSTQVQLSSSWKALRQSIADHRVGNDRLMWVIAMHRGSIWTVLGADGALSCTDQDLNRVNTRSPGMVPWRKRLPF